MHRLVIRKRLIASLASIALLAMLLVDARAMLRTQEDDFRSAGIGVPSHDWTLAASAPSKTWESPSLHQSIRKKAPPEAITLFDRATIRATTVPLDRPGNITKDSDQHLRLISPRAPPQRSISL